MFFSLPYELRREIYKYCIIESRRPPAETVHKKWLHEMWDDAPSPLLGVNQQIRAEIFDLLQRSPFPVRVSWQDVKFDGLAQSAFVAQQRTGYDVPHLIVEVWPPVSDRPIDTLLIWKHLREVRDQLSAASRQSRIGRFDLVFLENAIAKWTDCNGTPFCWMYQIPVVAMHGGQFDNDMTCMLSLFAQGIDVAEAHVQLPDSFLADGFDLGIRSLARQVEASMMSLDVRDINSEVIDQATGWEKVDDFDQWYLEYQTAVLARDRLDDMTSYGECKISAAAYEDFITIWPHFDLLTDWMPGGVFKGMWHYVRLPEKGERVPKD